MARGDGIMPKLEREIFEALEARERPVGPVETAAPEPSAVEIAMEAIRRFRYETQGLTPSRRLPYAEDIVIAEVALTALHDAGWRIVRVHPKTEPPVARMYLPVAEEWLPACPGDPDPQPPRPCRTCGASHRNDTDNECCSRFDPAAAGPETGATP